ncbi:MAG: glycosyltransferase family 4 protein [Acidobacteriota bacterium]
MSSIGKRRQPPDERRIATDGPAEPGWGARDARTLRARLRPVVSPARRVIERLSAVWQTAGGRPPLGCVRVYFGFRSLPRPDEIVAGGLVKIAALARAFPNTPRRWNLLYLVSSRLPPGAVALARAAKRKGLRVVVNQDGVAYHGWYGRGWETVNAPMATLLGLADHVFYQSRFCRMAADLFLQVQPAAWEILPNAVDTAAFSPAAGTERPQDLTLLLAGSQDKSYRVRRAIDALALVARRRPDARLVITGRLGWADSYEGGRAMALEWARQIGVADRVRFTGPYSQSQAVELFRQATILLHTKYNDPCPAVVVEAMACGVPVVYSATGGVPELVGSEAGVGVGGELSWDRDLPPDAVDLAEAVLTVAERHQEYGAAARQRAVDRFDLGPWLRRHTEVFGRLVE